ncbi:uncharacterized protein CLUP02_15330 [Colletotrichum lupini]|uniref:Uncharacterized protein n=1 Tax=Colletotrichum lupini TaxID=145971 RepID=A0A9Q8WNF6_9PEZI|nr:uncharacterized protein CLUP02_15330 [Colletotrichum lupini]UQC89799.1 hypothetical protein CLUP02_15330 [Colletotrichum lupini]
MQTHKRIASRRKPTTHSLGLGIAHAHATLPRCSDLPPYLPSSTPHVPSAAVGITEAGVGSGRQMQRGHEGELAYQLVGDARRGGTIVRGHTDHDCHSLSGMIPTQREPSERIANAVDTSGRPLLQQLVKEDYAMLVSTREAAACALKERRLL